MNAAHKYTTSTSLSLAPSPLSSMGEKAKKICDVTHTAEWRAKKASTEQAGNASISAITSTPADEVISKPTRSKPASQKSVAPAGDVSVWHSAHSCSALTPISSVPATLVAPTPLAPVQETAASHSCCSTSASAQALLVTQIQSDISKESEHGELSDYEDDGWTSMDDLEHIVSP